jgi:hypothetical protein
MNIVRATIKQTNVKASVSGAIVYTGGTTLNAMQLTVTSAGQTVFTLTTSVPSPTRTFLIINSATYINGIDYTVAGNTLTWFNLFQLKTTYSITLYY